MGRKKVFMDDEPTSTTRKSKSKSKTKSVEEVLEGITSDSLSTLSSNVTKEKKKSDKYDPNMVVSFKTKASGRRTVPSRRQAPTVDQMHQSLVQEFEKNRTEVIPQICQNICKLQQLMKENKQEGKLTSDQKNSIITKIGELKSKASELVEREKEYYRDNTRYLFKYFESKQNISKDPLLFFPPSFLNRKSSNNDKQKKENGEGGASEGGEGCEGDDDGGKNEESTTNSSISPSTTPATTLIDLDQIEEEKERKHIQQLTSSSSSSSAVSFVPLPRQQHGSSEQGSSLSIQQKNRERAQKAHRTTTINNNIIHSYMRAVAPISSLDVPVSRTAGAVVESAQSGIIGSDSHLHNGNIDYVCPRCKKGELVPLEDEGILLCRSCGLNMPHLVENDKQSYKEPQKDVCVYAYKRIGHFREIIMRFQGKENIVISEDILTIIRNQITKERLTKDQITYKKMKSILKMFELSDYYDNITYIRSLFGIKPPVLPDQLVDTLLNLFSEIQAPYARYSPDGRVNFFNYHYIFRKLLEHLKQYQYLPLIPKLIDRAKIIEQDATFEKVCRDRGWEFIPTD